MPDKRSLTPDPSPSHRPLKRRRSDSTESWDGHPNKPLRIFVVQAKLDEKEISEIYRLIESHGPGDRDDGLQLRLCSSPNIADIIITAVRMPKRFQRHVDWDVAKQKAIVTPEWLLQTIKLNSPAPYGAFAAISQLPPDHRPEDQLEVHPVPPDPPLPARSIAPEDPLIVAKLTSEKVKDNWRAKYACTRAHPLICPNQDLVTALNVLGHSRSLESLSINALAYERAIAIIKSYPFVITRDTFRRDVVKLPGIGSKIHAKIEEYLEAGKIEETETILQSERYRCLSLFTTVYGIGPSTARGLFEIGLRSVKDLERYYDVPQGIDPSQLEGLESQLFTPNGQPIPSKNLKEDAKIPPISIKIALVLREDFSVPITRSEVEEMHLIIMSELKEVQTGCISTIAGGYRRGKMESNDVDIVITHSDSKSGAGIIKGLSTKFVRRLYERGMVTHVMHLSGFHAHNPLRTENWDSLEKALTVFRLPASSSIAQSQSSTSDTGSQVQRLYRRLDLIFVPPEAYWTAVIGWSGSKMFERDLRLWAKVEKGMKFDSSGLTRRHDSKRFIPKSEEDVLKILGLEWIDPTMRNANV